ncbi:hypothetical protein [Nocardioides sp.]|uniref:hypothetical protein n=1 Tax=Nocardioides sp. TaxID=35761 RepID=UPI00260BF87A|nr:hypothetical protein [Nocardioides sp.]
MRRAAAVGVMAAVVLAGTSPAAGTWSDVSTVTGTPVSSGSLQAPVLTCQSVDVLGALGLRLLTKVVLTWTASTSPTLLDYTAQVVSPGTRNLAVTSNGSTRSTEITPDILTGLLGGTVTVRVQARLANSNWAASTDRNVTYDVLGLRVSC